MTLFTLFKVFGTGEWHFFTLFRFVAGFPLSVRVAAAVTCLPQATCLPAAASHIVIMIIIIRIMIRIRIIIMMINVNDDDDNDHDDECKL